MNSKQLLTLSSVSLVGASAAWATSDYGPAVDRLITACSKWYTSGYGHKFAVVHSMEGYYLTGTSYLRRCDISASCHYTVSGLVDYSGDAPRGEISQLVYESRYAWHATCWNQHSLGTEHEGFVGNPAWFTEEMYQASALLHRHMADKFGFAKDRNHIVGHNEKSSSAWRSYASANLGINPSCNTHTDPGSYWNWSHFMALIIGGTDNASFVSQSVANGTSFSPGQAFSCTFTMHNNGTTTWIANGGDGYTFNNNGGTAMGAPFATALGGNVGPGGNASFNVNFTAPTTPGSYTATFRMNSTSFTYFGTQVSFNINVVNPVPVITSQPASTTRNPGETATFTVAATGATGYQWKKNGVNISGATSATLTVSNVQLSNAGFYTVVVSNAGGSVTSSQAQLAVTAAPVAAGTGGGLRGLYYNNTDFSGLALSRLDGPVNFDWAAGSPGGAVGADSYSVRWTGQVEPRYSQTYTFYTGTDDGVRLWVNGVLLIDHWADQGYTEWSGSIALTAGQRYDIRMDYFENGGSASAQLRWSSASQVKELIPASQLYRPVPVLATIGNKTVPANSELSVPVSLSSWDQVAGVTPFEDFETYGDGTPTDQIMFRKPGNSSTTSGFLDGGVTNYNVPTASFPAGRSSARAMHVSWSFLAGTTDPWLRLTTFNAATRPNPTIDFTRSLWFDIYTDKALKVGVNARETSSTAAIGENGGTTGTIEFVGVTGKTTGTPSAPIPSRAVAAGSWATLRFELPQEPVTAFTGNGILESTTGKGVLEALALVAAGGTGTYHVYLDNFVQVQNGGVTYALEAGAPTGATIDANTGVFSWTPTAGQGPGSYTITVRVTNAGSPSLSDTESFVVTVEAAPVITVQPQDQNVFPGGSATFAVTATGTAPLTYQWHKDGGVISGATGSGYTLANAQASDSGSYQVVVANALGSATSSVAMLMVSDVASPPSFVAQPQSLTRNQGASATFGVTVAGSWPLSYQWYLNGTPISGATQNSYTDSNVQPADGGAYTCVVTNDFGSASSDPAMLTVIVAPTVTTQPVSQTVTQGGGVTFSVAASGSAPLSFQWRKGGTPISGATGTSYSLSNVEAANAGTYTVVVSNDAGSVTSGNAVLTVYVAPAITVQPVGQTLAAGSSATFSVTATGNPAPTYQWRRNGVNISGATGSSYTRSNIQSADVGLYSVVVSNLVGAATSSEASLALTGAIAFQDNFESGNMNQWTTAASPATDLVISTAQNHTSGGSYSAAQDSTGDHMYHNFGSYSGHTKLSYYFYDDGSTAASAKSYIEVRSYSGGTYDPTKLTQVLAIGKYNAVGANTGDVWDNKHYQLRVLYPSATYGWMNCATNAAVPNRSAGWHKFSIERLADGTTVNFTVDDVATRTITGVTTRDWNTVLIGGGSGANAVTAYTDDVLVEYFDRPSIVTQPVGQTVTVGNSATFSVVAADNPQTYQWRHNGVNIAGATTASLTVNNAQAADAGSYSVVVANGVGAVASANALLLVAPVITTQPASRTNVESSTVTFTVAADGQTPLSYQWKRNGINLSNDGIVSGAQTATLTLTGITEADEASYTVGVTNAAGGVVSEAAYLSVTPLAIAPVITLQPVSQAVGAGATVTFIVEATGTTPSYQWMFNGNPITGATAASYTRSNVQDADSGEYTVVVANAAGSVTSEPATLLINTAPSLAALPDRTVHAGCQLVMTVSASDPEAPAQTLNFSLEGAPAGATIDAGTGVFSWTPGSGDVGTTKTITVRVSDNGTPVQSAAQSFTVEIVGPPVITSAVIEGGTIVLGWNSIPDQTYRVQYKDNLMDAEWADLTDVSAADSTASAVAGLVDDNGPIPHRFFRIMVVN
ncbi:MAG TPA: immunoglobulin domain-containing protein [Candidatus Paceibacterota bacterium]|nr:immunoglobulin domain-containing protein [Verrucomicrobiota bacterium]HSA10450.1 immunoglobulin domain-containing protein [Candidatus Paceibacterota bacterium]